MLKIISIVTALVLLLGCSNSSNAKSDNTTKNTNVKKDVTKNGKVVEITTEDEFGKIIKTPNRLLVLDLYADWCQPCKMLAPILDEVAKDYSDNADFYRINTEKLPSVARAFNVTGIPYVVFFKDGKIMNAYTGLYPKEAYEQGVEIFSEEISDTADGSLINGQRVIEIPADTKKKNIVVYKGDEVKITLKNGTDPFTASMKDFSITEQSDKNNSVTLVFKPRNPGAYELVITNNKGRKDRLWIIVMEFNDNSIAYKNVSPKEFQAEIEKPDTYILDVRTQSEFKEGHIKGAHLLPVQVLSESLQSLESAKNKTILVYCANGNRSIVASKILRDAGFTHIINLGTGINGWIKDGYPTVK